MPRGIMTSKLTVLTSTPDLPDPIRPWMTRLAERVVEQIQKAGTPLCRRDIRFALNEEDFRLQKALSIALHYKWITHLDYGTYGLPGMDPEDIAKHKSHVYRHQA